MEHLYSDRVKQLKASEIREILKLTQQPDIISFAGGLPAPELFPIEEMKVVTQKVLSEMGQEALQYSTTEGYDPLRTKIAKRLLNVGIEANKDDILITNGSQQGLDFTGKIFLNPNDVVLCESPSYLGAINAFKAYECGFKEIQTDNEGMVLSHLEEVINHTPNAKFIYVIPDFQNPSGRTWSEARRKGLVAIANKYNLVIIEDNPYGELRFEGEMIGSIKSFDTEGRVVYLGTFSKTFSPGLRIGWVLASPNVLNKYIVVKQGADLQSSSISQRELNQFLEMYDFDAHIANIKKVYKTRRDLMIETIKSEFPKEAEFEIPSGGLFAWVKLPNHVNTKEVLVKAVENKVAFVPGGSFFPNGGQENFMRLNFSNMPEEKIVEGITRLGKILKDVI
ncbi:PLP-dependent aminotransferase family protein [Fusibacter bizertensis]|jgi:Transcriptional regulators containing a DNA-binding HTH domain and an aminotransferase domain (MocR family) and their eukaryotic orthologs|uniref:PLP-dependent aminotransferase family protein n=1 Tax=Fusibacter bizertensis TaxID=1488331 RepID=A0ABT6NA23_9FIRM|nr:PLP-dependent aminotransferase family protein [Fusibacter bizertensis]MDH8677268.1 PLP-dependent aminotransferase family protein [Fusibacter bizertensis]